MLTGIAEAAKAFLPIINRFISDPDQANKMSHEIALRTMELQRVQLEQASKERIAQVRVNEAAAASADPYTSRARPTCIYVMLFLFALGYIVPVALGIYCQLTGVDYSYQAPDVEFAWATLTGLLGFGGLRGYDKVRQSKAEAGTL